ncbi:MAG: SdrD B-like domain-containing protein [Planctomycetota bacterium]
MNIRADRWLALLARQCQAFTPLFIVTAILAFQASLVAQSFSVPIVNSGFEQDDIADGTRTFDTSVVAGWTFTAVGGFIDDGLTDPNSGTVDAFLIPLPEGDQALIIQEATLEQVLSFQANVGACTFSASVYVETLATSTNSISLFAGSELLATLTPDADGVWQDLSATFVISAGSAAIGQNFRIEIDQWANPNTFTYYDNIALECGLDPNVCFAAFASEVIDFYQGPGSNSWQMPNDALGNTPSTRFSSGVGGFITLGFGQAFSTSGTAAADICVSEFGVVDCYTIELDPADDVTEAILIAAGFDQDGDFFTNNVIYCGDSNIDLDAEIPGFAEGQLSFDAIKIVDDGSSGDGHEIERVEAKFICPGPPTVECAPAFAFSVVDFTQGANAISGDGPSGALGSDTNTKFSAGLGGQIALNFGAIFTTSGDSDADICIDEFNVIDCYSLQLDPADAATEAALVAAGFTQNGDYWDANVSYCGDQNIDIDDLIPGFDLLDLRFVAVQLVDDGSAGNGFELVQIEAKLVCGDPAFSLFAKIGDFVFVDDNCDGIQQSDESGLAGITVELLDETGTNVLMTEVTDVDGAYLFCVDPGSYVVRVNFDAAEYFLAASGQGSDGTLDSDFNPATGETALFSVVTSEINYDIDAALCEVCPGPAAFVNNDDFPSCGAGIDQLLVGTAPVIGNVWELFLNSDMPNVPFFVFAAPGAPVPITIPNSSCLIWPNLAGIELFYEGITDQNGNNFFSLVIPNIPALAGIQFTFQARVCDPAQTGPIPGTPDFPTNAVHVQIGCPE